LAALFLFFFGLLILVSSKESISTTNEISAQSNFVASFVSVFLLTISSPLTILFWMSLFATKTVESNYSRKELLFFGFAAGFATFAFLGSSVLLISFFKSSIPLIVVKLLNMLVGFLLVMYGLFRSYKVLNTVPDAV
jgi:threonine/homoserine/homoserine lactone efflux protein